MARPLSEVVEAGWARALEPVAPVVAQMGDFLRAQLAAGHRYLPAGANVLRAFTQPFDDVRVLVVGQDPYPTPGHAIGLSFSVAPQTRPIRGAWPTSSASTCDDLGHPTPSTGDLTPWADQGVLLLNRVLTVAPGEPGSHRSKGWETVTEQAIRALVDRDGQPLVAILWGRDARNLAPLLTDVPCVESAHPSPMSADRGFFGRAVQPRQRAARRARRRAGGLEAAVAAALVLGRRSGAGDLAGLQAGRAHVQPRARATVRRWHERSGCSGSSGGGYGGVSATRTCRSPDPCRRRRRRQPRRYTPQGRRIARTPRATGWYAGRASSQGSDPGGRDQTGASQATLATLGARCSRWQPGGTGRDAGVAGPGVDAIRRWADASVDRWTPHRAEMDRTQRLPGRGRRHRHQPRAHPARGGRGRLAAGSDGRRGSTAAAVAAALARGALRGARGNSGVIVSRGCAGSPTPAVRYRLPSGQDTTGRGAGGRRHAVPGGRAGQGRAVRRPVEGTVLSVLRAAAEAAADGRRGPGRALAMAAAAASGRSPCVADTPRQLPELARSRGGGRRGAGLVLRAGRAGRRGQRAAGGHRRPAAGCAAPARGRSRPGARLVVGTGSPGRPSSTTR